MPQGGIPIIIPARNEAGRIILLLRQLRRRGFRHVLVVDDASSDGTGEIVRREGAEVIAVASSQGKGYALRTGIAHALSSARPAAVVLMDGDGQHAPEDLPHFLETFEASAPDLIIGVRAFREMSLLRRYWNRWISALISAAIGRRLRDSQSGFRLLSHRAPRR